MVRAKFICVKNINGDVGLQPVFTDSEENKKFWNATPAGEIKMFITNENALNEFEVGQEYYIDFTKA